MRRRDGAKRRTRSADEEVQGTHVEQAKKRKIEHTGRNLG